MTHAARVHPINLGSFEALIDCVEEETPHVMLEGDIIDFDGETLLKASDYLPVLLVATLRVHGLTAFC